MNAKEFLSRLDIDIEGEPYNGESKMINVIINENNFVEEFSAKGWEFDSERLHYISQNWDYDEDSQKQFFKEVGRAIQEAAKTANLEEEIKLPVMLESRYNGDNEEYDQQRDGILTISKDAVEIELFPNE